MKNVEYNDENCKELAKYVVNSMDMDDLVSFAINELTEWYYSDEENFRDDLENSGFGTDEENEDEIES